jgi:hypothetical protein
MMKHKFTIALVAILTFSLLLSGCTVAATPAAEADTLTGNGTSGNTANAVSARAGNRGGSGNAQSETGDSCSPISGSATVDPDYDPSEADFTLSLAGYGAEGALEDESLTLADMLTYAIQDEYLARAEYDRIQSDFGNLRPFSNIMRAEETHIDALLPLFAAYDIAAPADEGAAHAVAVSSLTAAYQAGVNAEVNNIAMYDTFLEQALPSNVRSVFESLMKASENHLRAFQNQL